MTLTTVTHEDFEAAICESIDDSIRSLLSQEVLDAFHTNLLTKRSIRPQEISHELPTVSIVLRKYFGPSAETIERMITRKLYEKYGLEFPKNDKLQLEGYVQNLRNVVKSAPSKPTVSRAPKSLLVNLPLRDDFDSLFVESVKEAIQEALGEEQARLALRFITRDIPLDKLPRHLPTFYESLKKNFGVNTGVIETAIARKLYEKLMLDFNETPNTELGKYVEIAFVKLSEREQLGFVNISPAVKRL